MSREEFLSLVSMLVDDELSPEQMASLDKYLREHPQDRQYLLDHLLLDSMLSEEIDKESVATLMDMVAPNASAATSPRPASGRSRAWAWGIGAAAAILIAVGVILYSVRERPQEI